MKKLKIFYWLIVVIFLLLTTLTWGDVYKYKDANGYVHFVDSQNKIPDEYREKTEKLKYTAKTREEENKELDGKSSEQIEEMAKMGNRVAQFQMGVKFIYGNGVTKNRLEAYKWFSRSAEQGYASAQYSLGLMHKKGDGVSFDMELAKKYIEAAANQGYIDAQTNIGSILGNEGHYKESFAWYLKAANAGDGLAMHAVGEFYKFGQGGVARDDEEANRWFEKAKQAGYDENQQ